MTDPGTAFMSNTLRWADQLQAGDTVRAAFPNVATALLHPADLAAVAAAALLDPEWYAGQVLMPTGPAALFDFYAAGSLDESVVRPTVEQVTGRPPRTFADRAAAHTDGFAKD